MWANAFWKADSDAGRRPGTASMARETAHRSPLGSSNKVGTVDGRMVGRGGPPAEREQYEEIFMWIVVEGFRAVGILAPGEARGCSAADGAGAL